jgi:hypothetical protein
VSEHGLGHLLSPFGLKDRSKRWLEEGWEWVLGRRERPWWFDAPAVSRISISSPYVLRGFRDYNASRPRQEQIRAFNFCLSAHIAPFGHPEGVDPLRFHLIAPYGDDPRTYLRLEWADQFSSHPYRVTTSDDFGETGAVLLQTFGDVFARYARHLEAKSLDSEGRPGRGSGVLTRRPIREGSRAYVGKESNRIEEVEMGVWHQLESVMTGYGWAHDSWRVWVAPILQQIPLTALMNRSGLDRRTLQRLRNGHTRPHRGNELTLTRIAGEWARAALTSSGLKAPRDDVLACRAWIESMH